MYFNLDEIKEDQRQIYSNIITTSRAGSPTENNENSAYIWK